MSCRSSVVWDEGVLGYNFGNHPLNPIRLEFTVALARELGVLDDVEVVAPRRATREELLVAHDADYLDAVQAAGEDPTFSGYGLGTDDDPVFSGMYDASALVAGGALVAADAVSSSAVEHALNLAGGRRAAGRLCRHRRAPRRRRPGRVLRRPAGLDHQPASGPQDALPRHWHAVRAWSG